MIDSYKPAWHLLLIVGAVLVVINCSIVVDSARGQKEHVAAKGSAFKEISADANAARDADQLDRAISLYKRALALRPGWTEGWFSLGTIDYDQNNYPDAARAFAKVRALDPKAGTARVMLGLSEFELGQDANALKHIEEGKAIGIAEDPQLRHVMLYHEGVLLQRAAKFQNAQVQLRRLCADGVEDANVTQALGLAALRMPDKGDMVKGSPGAEVVSGVGRAECLGAQKKFDDARAAYNEIIQSYPQYPNIHFAYGRFLLGIDETDAGIAEFQKEIANNPNHVFARLEIAAAKYSLDSKGGLPYAEQAVKMNPNFPLGHYLLGLLLLDTGDYKGAIPELEVAKNGYPNEARVYFALGSAYAQAGRKDDAARARATFLRLNQRNQLDPEIAPYAPKVAGPANARTSKPVGTNSPQH